MSPRLRVISLGAGVQSTTMALMAAHGEIEPMPDCALFADTQWEPKEVYEHLDWLRSGNVLPFPVHVITAGDLRQHVITGVGNTESSGEHKFCSVPFFTEKGLGKRECTSHYKIEPLNKTIRQMLGYKKGQKTKEDEAEVWVGISTDEIIRMKDSRARFIQNRWPLIEKRMARGDCYEWLRRNGYPQAPRSAYVACPFKKNKEWRHLKNNFPEEWGEAVYIDRLIRNSGSKGEKQYVHRSKQPLEEADLTTEEDHGQLTFLDECEGMCGV